MRTTVAVTMLAVAMGLAGCGRSEDQQRSEALENYVKECKASASGAPGLDAAKIDEYCECIATNVAAAADGIDADSGTIDPEVQAKMQESMMACLAKLGDE